MSLFSKRRAAQTAPAAPKAAVATKKVVQNTPKNPSTALGSIGGPIKNPTPIQPKPTGMLPTTGLRDAKPAMPARAISQKPLMGSGGVVSGAGVAPTRMGRQANRAVAATKKPTATPKSDPTAKSYTDDIYAKYEGQSEAGKANKTPKKAAKASYR